MRELTNSDMIQATGGLFFAPLLPAVIAVGSTFAKGGAGYFLGGVGIGMALHQAYDHYSSEK